jgi:hypothetical protein
MMAVNSLCIQHLLAPHAISDYTIGHRKRLEINRRSVCCVVRLVTTRDGQAQTKTRQHLVADRVSVLNEQA